jgi:diguanylate cyclase (GGDEF)-like protein
MHQRLTVFLSSHILMMTLLMGAVGRFPAIGAFSKTGVQPATLAITVKSRASGRLLAQVPAVEERNRRAVPTPSIESDPTSRLDYQEAERLLNQLTTLIFIVGSLLGLIISLLLDKTIRDNQRIRTATQELERLANLDGLTQIANRRTFEAHLQQEWARAMRDKNSLTLILCDVDHFRQYNQNYGHQAGDDCLRQLALVLDRTAKRPGDMAARYGGEEFAVILPNTDTAGGVVVAQTIQEAVGHLPLPEGDGATPVSLSLGVASVVPTPDGSVGMLLELSDRALFLAKERGRNRMVCLAQNAGEVSEPF